jgi:hypothetical protein
VHVGLTPNGAAHRRQIQYRTAVVEAKFELPIMLSFILAAIKRLILIYFHAMPALDRNLVEQLTEKVFPSRQRMQMTKLALPDLGS